MIPGRTVLVVLTTVVCLCNAQQQPGQQDLTLDEVIVRSYTSGRAADFIQGNNSLLVELDVILTPDQWANRNKRRGKRSGVIGDEWPNAVVPFERIDRNEFTEKDIEVIRGAFREFRRYSCINFRPKKRRERAHIWFYDGGRCSSGVGYRGTDYPVSLAPKGCRTHGVVVHELLHAVGVHHEQTRTDRDQYVTINEDNISKSQLFNFEKYDSFEVSSRGIPYDYLSIMHYGATAFAKDNSKPSIITRDSRFKHRIGQRYGMSFEDIKLINAKYKCSAACGDQNCPEGAFMSKDCQCWCKRNVEFGEPVALCDSGERVPGGGDDARGFGTCGDKRTLRDCQWWKEKGYCEDGNRLQEFMVTNCRDTCGWCGQDEINAKTGIDIKPEPGSGGAGGAGGGTSISTESGGFVLCKNEDMLCMRWAKMGFCEGDNVGGMSPSSLDRQKNAMLEKCKRSCGACGDGVQTAYVCNYETLDLACPSRKVLKIHTAMYGRKNTRTCARRKGTAAANCHSPQSLSKTKELCEGKIYCTITASRSTFPTDRCPDNTSKYLQVRYSCEDETTDPTTVITEYCEDEHPSCSNWVDHGFCTDPAHQPFMSRACRKSCSICGASQAAAPKRDIYPACEQLKSRGDCDKNPHWMGIYCRATCKSGRSGFRRGPCKDANPSCQPWVDRGMCEDNSEYMRMNCAKSCSFCK